MGRSHQTSHHLRDKSKKFTMGIPTVNKACIVFELKTGTIILGVINLIFSVIGTIAVLAMLIGYAVGSNSIKQALHLQESSSGDQGTIDAIFYVTWIILLAVCAFYIIIASLLIQGARTSRPGFLTPWLVLTGISMVLQVLKVIGSFIAFEWGAAFSTLVALVIQAYLFVCVHSLKKQIEDGGNSMPMQTRKA